MTQFAPHRRGALAIGIAAAGLGSWLAVQAQSASPHPDLRPLELADVPRPPELTQYIKNNDAAILLGKALFWDMNLGSDGKTACATCHHAAGTDSRTRNQFAPAFPARYTNADAIRERTKFGKAFVNREDLGVDDIATTTLPGGGPAAPNVQLAKSDFPLFRLQDPKDRESAITFTTDDVVGSAGVHARLFTEVGTGSRDACTTPTDETPFRLGALRTRQVTARNAPTVINAVLNDRNFWDGRAQSVFNGVSPFGDADPDAFVYQRNLAGGVERVRVRIRQSSAASQAVGPVDNSVEMACATRIFPLVGQRLLPQRGLAKQAVHPEDSVLGSHAAPNLVGLNKTYAQMVRDAFHDRWWSSNQTVAVKLSDTSTQSFSQMEANFSLFFGLAVQAYEATLISHRTPLDDFLRGNAGALTLSERNGLDVFIGKGKCISCHKGPELTGAGTPLRRNLEERVEHMRMGDGGAALYDNGFYNIGVTGTARDLGVGGRDPWGNPLSFTRQYKNTLSGFRSRFVTDIDTRIDIGKWDVNPGVVPPATVRDAVDGAFKTPGLRNVELTGPYFHDGQALTLEQVVQFYDRGGNRRKVVREGADTTGFVNGQTGVFDPHTFVPTVIASDNRSNLDPDIEALGLTDQEKADLVAFLKRPLTDERVLYERAPFDRPALSLPSGHDTSAQASQLAADLMVTLPAVGRNGRRAPLPTFEQRLPAIR